MGYRWLLLGAVPSLWGEATRTAPWRHAVKGEKVSKVTRLRVWKSDLWAGTGQTHSHPDATSVVLASDYEKLEAENQRLRGWLNDKMVITLWSEPDSDGDTWPEEWEPALDLFHHAALEDTHE